MANNDDMEDEEFGLTQEELEKLYLNLEECLSGKMYDDKTSAQLINDILEKIMDSLHSFSKPYKYIANCVVSQRVGAGFTNSNSALFEKPMDNVYNIYYPKDKNQSGKDKAYIFGLVTIFVVSF